MGLQCDILCMCVKIYSIQNLKHTYFWKFYKNQAIKTQLHNQLLFICISCILILAPTLRMICARQLNSNGLTRQVARTKCMRRQSKSILWNSFPSKNLITSFQFNSDIIITVFLAQINCNKVYLRQGVRKRECLKDDCKA